MQKILLAIDGSETSMKASEETIKLAKVFNVEVVIFSVVYEPPNYYYHEGISDHDINQILEKNLQYRVAACETLITAEADKFKAANINVSTKVVTGRPSDEIIEEVEKGDYDLVVLGSRGLTGIKKILLGTVSGKVANNVKCSVYIVK